MKDSLDRRTWLGRTAAGLLSIGAAFAIGLPSAQAAPRPSALNVIPTINGISVQNGQLVASGAATAVVKGQTYTAPFTAPVNITLAEDQSAGAGFPVLDLALGPINLDLLGLVVETSPICLQIVAHPGEGLLGDLLFAVGNLLNGGLSLDQILAGQNIVDPVTGLEVVPALADLNGLLDGITNLLNTTLGQLLGAVLTNILDSDLKQTCSVLHLELGPVDLTLLGLQVILDDCDGGPVVVDITAETGRGNLLGNLLCGLLGGGGINIGGTLGSILDSLLGAIRQ